MLNEITELKVAGGVVGAACIECVRARSVENLYTLRFLLVVLALPFKGFIRAAAVCTLETRYITR